LKEAPHHFKRTDLTSLDPRRQPSSTNSFSTVSLAGIM
jgi:hypothetical protein